MDGLSLVSNIIAVVGAARTAGDGIQRLRRAQYAPEQLSSEIQDELLNFQIVIAAVNRIVSQLGPQPEDPLFTQYLQSLLRRATTQLAKLNDIVENSPQNDLAGLNEQLVKGLWKRWFKGNEIHKLGSELRTIRQDLAAALTVLTASETPRIRTSLREIVLRNQENVAMIERFRAGTNDRLELMQRSVATLPTLARQIEAGLGSFRNAAPRPALGTASTQIPAPVRLKLSETGCKGLCLCRCHKPLKLSSPEWAKSLIGIILLSWSGVLQRPICTEKRCQRSTTNMLKLQYYFPSWFVQRVIHIRHQFMLVEGHQINVKTPRIVPGNSQFFFMVREGNISHIQYLFSQGLASPFDVNPEGHSCLAAAITFRQVDTCKLLLENSADTTLADINSIAPIDAVWSMVLTDPNSPVTQAMKALFEPYMDPVEDLQNYGFNAVHQIVLGISKLNLEDHLQLSTNGIDDGCSLGRTPLIWAVMSGNIGAAKTLLEHEAKIESLDHRDRNVFHYAVRSSDTKILELLLHAAYVLVKEPQLNPCDNDIGTTEPVVLPRVKKMLDVFDANGGNNPLSRAILVNQSAIAQLLVDYGASLDLQEDIALRPNPPSSPILQAAEYNAHKILRLLLQRGAKRGVLDLDGMGLLHLAGGIGDLETIQILTHAKLCCLDTSARSKDGRTPVQTFEEDRPILRPQDDEATRMLHRNAFLELLDSVIPSDSDHICTVNGFNPASIQTVEDLSNDSEEDEFFEASSVFEAVDS